MNRHHGKFSLRLALILLVSVLTSGCGNLFQKQCQPASAPVRNLEDATWRLTFTNNPSSRYRDYDFIFTFEIWSFTRQFEYSAKLVRRNRQFNNPISTGTYDTNGDGTMELRLTAPPSGGEGEEGSSGGQSLGTFRFNYSLGSKLELQDSNTGFIYRFSQFTGVVSPSSACTF